MSKEHDIPVFPMPGAMGQHVNFPQGGRVVYVNGARSMLLEGDSNGQGAGAGGALPPLLKQGWKIFFVLPTGTSGSHLFFLAPPADAA